MLWLLMTGEIPTNEQVKSIQDELNERAHLPKHVEDAIRAFPKEMHPMTKLSSAVLGLQVHSKFATEYKTAHRNDLWKPAYEDAMNLIATLPEVCGLIYRTHFADGVVRIWATGRHSRRIVYFIENY